MKIYRIVAIATFCIAAWSCTQHTTYPTDQLSQVAEEAYTQKDRVTLLKLLKDPRVREDSLAGYFVGIGLMKFEEHQTDAFNLLKASAAMGNRDASFQLAQAYENGTGTERDLLAALDHYRAAVKIDNALNDRMLFQQTEGGPWVGRSEEIKRLMELAESGDILAQYLIGKYFDHGDGVPQNSSAAIYWYTRAAEQGHESANLTLGYFYCRGIGVERDAETAERFLTASNRKATCNTRSEP